MITCLSGLVNFSQAGLDALTHGPLDGNPTPINIFMAAVGTLLAVALAGFVYVKSRDFKEEACDQNGVTERMGLIREETGEYGTIG
jgi:hypothetical protein